MNDCKRILNQYTYYLIIAGLSLIVLFFVPFLGSEIGLALAIPDTAAGWIVWVTVKLVVAAINVVIFYSFMQQAKINVKEDVHYREAMEILGRAKRKNYMPRSPEKWNAKQYSVKAVTIFVSTALATIALTQAILTFDWVSMLTYLFTIVLGLVCGVLQMKSAETYWTDEFWKYAKMIQEQDKEEADASDR